MKGAKQRGSNRGLWALLGGLGCVICVLTVVLVVMQSSHPVEPEKEETAQGELISDDWSEYIINRDVNELIGMTNRQIESASDNETKSTIYSYRAAALYSFDVESESAEYGDQILSDAYNAEEYYPTDKTAYLVYFYEQIYGDPVVAEEYLNIAKERGMTVSPGKG